MNRIFWIIVIHCLPVDTYPYVWDPPSLLIIHGRTRHPNESIKVGWSSPLHLLDATSPSPTPIALVVFIVILLVLRGGCVVMGGNPRPKLSYEFLLTCSAKFCDNLLVEADVFYHFRGLILCNAKCLQFYINKHNSNIVAQFNNYYIQLSCPFLFMQLLVPFSFHKKIPFQRLHCHFWWMLDNTIFHTN